MCPKVLKLSSNVSDVLPNVLKLSFEVSECKPLVGGNWKCNGNTKSIAALVKQLNAGAIHADVEIICAPPALYLPTVSHAPPPPPPRRGRNPIA